MSDCLSPSEVADLLTDKAASAEIARAEAHQQECAKCRRAVAQLRDASVGKNLRTALWIVAVGLLFGGLLPLGVVMPAVGNLLEKVRDAYAKFPSLPVPWLATIDLARVPEPVQQLLVVIAMFAIPWMGLVIVRKLRPQGPAGDAAIGWLTGLVAGLSFYVSNWGWYVMLVTMTVPSLVDLELLGSGYASQQPSPTEASAQPKPHSQDALLQRYPDLANVPEHERGTRVFTKIVADQVVASAYGNWIGLPLTLLCFGLAGIGQTMSAGYLLRRDGLRPFILFSYIELAVATEWLAVSVCALVAPVFSDWPGLHVVLPLSLTAVAVTAVRQRWPVQVRYSLYACWFVVGKLLFDMPLPWYADILVFVVAVLLLVPYFRKKPQPVQPAAESPAIASPAIASPAIASPPIAPPAPAISAPPVPDAALSAPVEVAAGAAEAPQPDAAPPGNNEPGTDAGFDWERLK